jgi:hypothetical protein
LESDPVRTETTQHNSSHSFLHQFLDINMPERSFSLIHIVRNSVLIIAWIWYIVFTSLLSASDKFTAPVYAAMESDPSMQILSALSTPSSRPQTTQVDSLSSIEVHPNIPQEQVVMMPVAMPNKDAKEQHTQIPSGTGKVVHSESKDHSINTIPQPSRTAMPSARLEWPCELQDSNAVYVTISLTRTETVTLYRPRVEETIVTALAEPEATGWSAERELKV